MVLLKRVRVTHYRGLEKVLHLRFEWDHGKDSANRRKHGVSFDEAATVFGDPLALIVEDETHGDRWKIVGLSSSALLVVVYQEKDDGKTIRIISARRANRSEKRTYEEGA